jgi:glycosyltransferase involved in cell wall biosynthesis
VRHRLHFVVPGPLEQRTGGYLYDARMVQGLRARGWEITVHNLEGRFPDPDATARADLEQTLASIAEKELVLVDGLAMGGLPDPIRDHAGRLRILSLVHHPLADETGLSPTERRHFVASERSALEHCTGVIVTSAYTAQHLASYGVDEGRVRSVPPGTVPAPYAPGPATGAPTRILCVATVTPRKGHDVLVEALQRVRDLSWTCVCAGSLERDPIHAVGVLELVERYGLGPRIAFVGEHDAQTLDALYAESSVFALASHYEGYGMALAEALARGLPVVSTTGGAIPHTVPEEAGILVPTGNPAAFAEALRRLLRPDGTERAALATAARRHAETLPDWEACADAFERAVLELGGPSAA